MLEGDEIARTVARVTERAAEADYPRLCREAALCADALETDLPPIHIARGEERFCRPDPARSRSGSSGFSLRTRCSTSGAATPHCSR